MSLPPPRPLQVAQPELRKEAPAGSDSLAELPLFQGLSPTVVDELEVSATDVELDADEHLFHQGDVTDGLYILRNGLERAELDADRVVLTAGAQKAAWRDLYLRVADRVVVVSGEPAPPL